jgi:hypothetical protein
MNSAKEKNPKQTAMGKLLVLICGKKKSHQKLYIKMIFKFVRNFVRFSTKIFTFVLIAVKIMAAMGILFASDLLKL